MTGNFRTTGSTQPRLLVAAGPLSVGSLSWAMDTIADAGFAGTELLVTHNPQTRDPDTVLGCAAEAGLEVPVVHGPYMLLVRDVFGSWYRTKTRRSLEFAAAVGADTMVAHAPFRWERWAQGWLTGEAVDEASELGQVLGMENLYPVRGWPLSTVITPEDMRAFPDVVFDTSHFAVAGIDLFTAWESLRGRVRHVHLSDNLGDGKDSHAPIGTGVLPLDAFLAHIGRSGYTGTITLELSCRGYLGSRERLLAFLRRQRTMVEALLAGEGAPVAQLDTPPAPA